MLNGKRLCAWLMLALMMFTSFAWTAAAEEEALPLTWEEYVTLRGIEAIDYETAAAAIDEVIDEAVALYEGGDAKQAYTYAKATYWGYYETTGFERNVNTYISGKAVSLAELQFSALRSAIKKDKGVDVARQAGGELSATLHEQGAQLNEILGLSAAAAPAASAGEVPFTWEEYEAQHGITGMNYQVAADAIDEVIDKAVSLYESGDSDTAYAYAKATYWGYYETTGFERNVNTYISGKGVSLAELQFSALRSAIKKDKGLDVAKQAGEDLSATLHEQAEQLNEILGISADTGLATSEGTETPAQTEAQPSRSLAVATFIGAFGIILREGLEAILVVGAIIAYLIKSGNRAACKPVYIGAAFAVVCSFGMAAIIAALKAANAENAMSQEIIEGVAALLAVCVLFYVSNWMVSKAESEAWNQYIEGKVASSASRGSMFTLGFTAWLAVFREGAEVILFYQPLMQGNNGGMVWAGFGVGVLVLVVVFMVIRFLSIRLPLKPFFLGTSILMAVMSICFLGSGIKELIEGGVIEAAYHDWFPLNDVLDIFGIYPLYETLIPQAILLIITIVTFAIQINRGRKLAKEAKAAQ